MIVHKLLAIIVAAVALNTDAFPGSEAVTEVRVAAAGGETEIVVVAEGDIQVSDFLLDEPTRLILDLRGARHALPRYAYEEIGRGGVIRMRTSQFLEDVVRLVIDLTFAPTYTVSVNRGVVRVWSQASTKRFPSALVIPTLRQMGFEKTMTRTMTSPTPLRNWNSLTKRAFKVNTDTEIPKEGMLN